MRSIPLLDLEPWFDGDAAARRRVAAEVDANLRRVGFLVVVNHGIDPGRVQGCRDGFREFFHGPIADKEAVRLDPTAYRGWVGPGRESNAATAGVDTPPDAKETFGYGPVDVPDERLRVEQWRWYGPNRWPQRPARLREVAEWWWRAARGLSDSLLELFAVALGLPDRHLVDRSGATIAQGVAHWYWPRSHRAALDGEFRVGPHTDFGTLTVLDRQPGVGGLQVLDEDGTWIDAPVIDGSLIVNTGDMMRRWTNDRWCSNPHRVLPPPDGQDEELISLVFFHGPDHDALVEALPTCTDDSNPARHEPVLAAEYLGRKLDALAIEPDRP